MLTTAPATFRRFYQSFQVNACQVHQSLLPTSLRPFIIIPTSHPTLKTLTADTVSLNNDFVKTELERAFSFLPPIIISLMLHTHRLAPSVCRRPAYLTANTLSKPNISAGTSSLTQPLAQLSLRKFHVLVAYLICIQVITGTEIINTQDKQFGKEMLPYNTSYMNFTPPDNSISGM